MDPEVSEDVRAGLTARGEHVKEESCMNARADGRVGRKRRHACTPRPIREKPAFRGALGEDALPLPRARRAASLVVGEHGELRARLRIDVRTYRDVARTATV